ncbi:MAG: hypothetical protein AAGN46_15970 [Acidobacteriota bacterium]
MQQSNSQRSEEPQQRPFWDDLPARQSFGRRARWVALVSIAFCAVGLSAGAQADSDEPMQLELDSPRLVADGTWSVQDVAWSTSAEDLLELHLENPAGELYLRPGPGSQIEVVGTLQRHVDDPRAPTFEQSLAHGTLHLRFGLADAVAHPSADSDAETAASEAPISDAWRKRRLDLIVFVPRELVLEAETLHERLRVKNASAPLRLKSTSGRIWATTTHADVVAHSAYADVEIYFGGLEGKSAPRLSSITGSIAAHLPWDWRPCARLETRGTFLTDYSLDVEPFEAANVKVALVGHETPGGAARDTLCLSLSSERGDLRLARRISSSLEASESQHEGRNP